MDFIAEKFRGSIMAGHFRQSVFCLAKGERGMGVVWVTNLCLGESRYSNEDLKKVARNSIGDQIIDRKLNVGICTNSADMLMRPMKETELNCLEMGKGNIHTEDADVLL